ncbi:uncharacterized protein LOC144709084 [Wolffia australiana]
MYPSVYVLQVHDENMQSVVYDEGESVNDIMDKSARTAFIEWMRYNREHLEDEVAKRTLRVHFVWPRDSMGYYLWLMLHHVPRVTCYEDLSTVDGVFYDMYQRAAQARGLLHSNEEFDKDLALAACVASPRQVHELFKMMLLYCDISQPDVLLEKYLDSMLEDIRFANGVSQVVEAIRQEVIKASRRNAISTTTSGIATLLLEGGQTLHSTFKIPIPVTHISMCEISLDSKISCQIQSTSIIIVDEAPMMHCHVYKTLDRSIRDVMKTIDASLESVPFGSKVAMMGGYFRQMLPVLPKGSRSMIVSSSLNRSDVWRHCSIFHLRTNVYGTFEDGATQLIEKMILTPLNDDVVKVNNMVLDVFPGEVMEYFSFDATPPGELRGSRSLIHAALNRSSSSSSLSSSLSSSRQRIHPVKEGQAEEFFLVARRQMVGILLIVWLRGSLRKVLSHLSFSAVAMRHHGPDISPVGSELQSFAACARGKKLGGEEGMGDIVAEGPGEVCSITRRLCYPDM